MSSIKTMKQIAELSVELVSRFRGEYSDEILQAFSLVGKYMTIAGLDKETRKAISLVTMPEYCPLCQLYEDRNCIGCELKRPESIGCGHQYDGLKQAVCSGTYTDVAFNMGLLVKNILSKTEDDDGNYNPNWDI